MNFEIGNIVQVIFDNKICTGRIIKFGRDGECRVRYYNPSIENMRIGEFDPREIHVSSEREIDNFLAICRAHNLKVNLALSSTKRHEANARRFD